LRQPDNARLSDVAAAAGVSTAAVSRYINRKVTLRRDTAERIDAAVAALGYRPNPHARRLSLGRSDVIGLVVPDIANPFFGALADAVEQAAEAVGLNVLLFATRNRPEQEMRALARLRHHHVDGLIFLTNHADDGRLAAALAEGCPVVLLDEDVTGAEVPRIFADNHGGGILAAEHLMQAGHRRLGFLGGPPGLLSTVERHAGFAQAVASAGNTIAFESFGEYTAAEGRQAARRLFTCPNRPTAVFATSDATALGVLEAAREAGVTVPDALSIVAFDDVGPLHLLQPPLTAIRQPVAALGRQGVTLLLARIQGGAIPRYPARLPVELVRRGSVAPPPVEG
jgi:LacI family transcriptional regulator